MKAAPALTGSVEGANKADLLRQVHAIAKNYYGDLMFDFYLENEEHYREDPTSFTDTPTDRFTADFKALRVE